MKVRLHEIEFGTSDPEKSKQFYQSALNLDLSVDQDGLKVFKTGIDGLDFNTSIHLPPKVAVTSFLTEDLQAVIDRLKAMNVSFEEPKVTHLGMLSIEFKDPDGNMVKVNAPTSTSPSWLKV